MHASAIPTIGDIGGLLAYVRANQSGVAVAHTLALAYWTFQVAVLTPPWFAFQGQGEAVLHVVLIMLTLAATLNVVLWRSAGRR